MDGACGGSMEISKYDDYIWVNDLVAYKTKSITVAIKQVPNCPIVYNDDRTQRERLDENFYAHSWGEFMRDPNHDPRKLNSFPMVKSVYKCMQAAQQYILNISSV